MASLVIDPRMMCRRCRRPERVCFCRHLVSIPSLTRVVLVQHPRERNMAIGTARMASLCLPNSELHVGMRWDGTPAQIRASSDPTRPAVLLYPGADAIDITREPPRTPVTLIVVDGTWAQAKKLVRTNPGLAALPRYSFVPTAPSDYRIRREPKAEYVSTIEAVVHVLGALEGDAEKFVPLLVPFRAMIDTQIEHIERLRHRRARVLPRPVRKIPVLPEILRTRARDLVCVFGDANGWPHGSPRRGANDLADLLRWVALRPATAEQLEAVIAPRAELAHGTSSQLGIDDDVLLAGQSEASFVAQWNAFVRPTDVLCVWGDLSLRLLAATGVAGGRTAIDLRQVVATLENRRPGAVEQYHARIGLAEPPAIGKGRAARRVGLLAAIVRNLLVRYGAANEA